MQEKLVLYLGLLFYSVCATTLLVLFDAAFITTLLVLFGVPIVWWWHELYPSKRFLYMVAGVTVSTTLLFESIAHVSGAWYVVGEGYFRLFGIMPLEVFILSFLQFVYVLFFHEFFVDDKKLHHFSFDNRKKRLSIFLLLIVLLGLLQVSLFSSYVLPFAFSWIAAGIAIVTAVAALLSHQNTRAVLEKALHTVVLTIPLLLFYEIIALFNIYIVYAHSSEYLATLTIFGETVPVEKLLQVTLLSFWMVVVYELYFDDAV